MNSKHLAPLAVLLLLLCAREAAAQPTCTVNYDISYPCHLPIGDIIFVGRVVSLTDMRPDEQGNSRQAHEHFISGY